MRVDWLWQMGESSRFFYSGEFDCACDFFN